MPHGKTHSTDWVGGGHAIPPHRGGARARAHSVTSRAALQLLGQQIGACQADTLDAYRLWHRAGRDTETGDRVEIKIISAHASTRREQANAKQLQSYSKSAGSAELPTWGAHKAVAGQLAVVDVHLERVDDVLLVLALELHDELCGVALCLRCERLAVAVPSLPLPRLLEHKQLLQKGVLVQVGAVAEGGPDPGEKHLPAAQVVIAHEAAPLLGCIVGDLASGPP